MTSTSQRGGAVATVLFCIGIMVLIVMVGVVAGGLYIAHHFQVTASDSAHGQIVSIETPFGSMRVREDSRIDPKRLGVPVYPGAVLRQDHHKLASVQLQFEADDSKELALMVGEYTTSDSLEKVREYYRRELPHWLVSEDRHGGVRLSFTEGGHKRIIVLKERSGLTWIALASVGEPAVN